MRFCNPSVVLQRFDNFLMFPVLSRRGILYERCTSCLSSVVSIMLPALQYRSPAQVVLCSRRQRPVCRFSFLIPSTKPSLFLFQTIHKMQAFESLGKLNRIYSSGVQTCNHNKKYSLCCQPTHKHILCVGYTWLFPFLSYPI